MAIVVVRHGETAFNAARVLQPPDTPLSERGHAQARALAQRLAQSGIGALICSDLLRAVQTAAAITQLTGIKADTDAQLQERNFGTLRGRAYDTLGFDPLQMSAAPPGGESIEQFEQRVAGALAALCARAAAMSGDLIVVTHGLFIRTLLQRHLLLPAGHAMPEHMANTSLTRFEPLAPYRAGLVNCDAHLDGATRADRRGISGI